MVVIRILTAVVVATIIIGGYKRISKKMTMLSKHNGGDGLKCRCFEGIGIIDRVTAE